MCIRDRRNNNQLQALIHGKDIVIFMSHRLCWLGYVERISEERMSKEMLKGRLCTSIRRGRPRMRWLNGVIVDLAWESESGEEGQRTGKHGGILLRTLKPTKGCNAR